MLNFLDAHIAPLRCRRSIIVAWALMLMTVAAHSQVIIDGKRAFSDSASDIILYCIPQECFGHDFTATVQIDSASHWDNVTINSRPLINTPITFHNVSGNKAITIRATINHRPIVKRLMFTFLPIISIEDSIGYDFVDTHVTLMAPDGEFNEAMTAQVKWRGGYTNTEDRHKRNYSIKFVNEQGESQNRQLLGMRRDNHWKLDAGQVDLSRVRNRVATDLWLDMARPPYYYDQAPDALTGARGKMVEVFTNGSYMGIYSLMESIDRKQLQVKKYDEESGTFHGMIWNAASWSKVAEFKSWVPHNNNLPNYETFVIEYPDFEDVHPTQHEDLSNAVKFVAQGNVNTFNERAHQYFDIPVLIDYSIFIQFLIAVDNSVNNIFWVIYDREVDKKLTLAVWDLDWTLGMDRDSQSLHGGRADPHHDLKFSSIELRMFSLPECVYHRDFIDRYWQLRKTWLSEKSLIERMNKAVDPLVESGAVAREQARWSGDSDINGLTLDIVAEKDFIIDWIKERLAYLDRTMMRHPCDVNGDGAVTAYDISMILSCLTDGTQTNVEDLDINGDGNVTAADLTRIYEYVLGL